MSMLMQLPVFVSDSNSLRRKSCLMKDLKCRILVPALQVGQRRGWTKTWR